MKELETNIIRRVLGGDSDAFGILVEWYAPKVFSLVIKIVPEDAEAEEIVQDVMLKAFRHLGSFSYRSSFATWLYRIAYNEAVSRTRRASSREIAVDDATLCNISDSAAEALLDSPDADDGRLAALPEALEMLSAEERAAITLYYYEEMPVKEIAEVMHISQSNVKVRLMRTRKKLYVLINKIAGARKY